MIQVQIIRTLDNGVQITGKIYVTVDQHFGCDTLERSYKNNQRGISSIPAGKYFCKKVAATAAIPYQHISVTNVPNRAGICIHSGNSFFHSKGCILVGNLSKDINGDEQIDILQSKDTFIKLMNVLTDEFTLNITEAITKTKNNEFKD